MIGFLDLLRLSIPFLCNHPQKYAHPYAPHPSVTQHADGVHEVASLRMTCILCGKDNLELSWVRLNERARSEMPHDHGKRIGRHGEGVSDGA